MRPTSIKLDASTVCQLRCPSCSTAQGAIKQKLGENFLKFSDFKKLIDENSWIAHIELSNWGEIFLNPDIYNIIEYAYKKNIVLTASNGVNLNTVKEKVLEGLVKYKFFTITCSIDGVGQETYGTYRSGGNFVQVIENIKIINFYKAKYRSLWPFLKWQFIVFGHNYNEINAAKELAKELGMTFLIKLNHDETYSPVRNRKLVTRSTKLKVISRSEYYRKYGKVYLQKEICSELWNNPQINWDGRVLGCCRNFWGDFGNAFNSGLENCLNGEKMKYARQMLVGIIEAKDDIPCATCQRYEHMKKNLDWLTNVDIWNMSIKAKQGVYTFIHRVGWKMAGAPLNIISRIFKPHNRLACVKR